MQMSGLINPFPVTWDINSNTNGKIFGYYISSAVFYDHLLRTHSDPTTRFGYEFIEENHPCAAYFDVEWKGIFLDSEHMLMKVLIAELRVFCNELGRDPEVHVNCGSRPIGDTRVKNSYHVVIANFVFPCNTAQSFIHFRDTLSMRVAKLDLPQNLAWFAADKEGDEPKHVIDKKVNTRNRSMRLPLCCKRIGGSNVPLRRISGDPFKDILIAQEEAAHQEDDVDSEMVFLLRRSAVDLPPLAAAVSSNIVTNMMQVEEAPRIRQQPRARRPLPKNSNHLPFDVNKVVELIRLKGDTVSQPTHNIVKEDDYWRIQFSKPPSVPRTCLYNPAKSHESNNFVVFVKPSDEGFFVTAQCFGLDCGKTVQIGRIIIVNPDAAEPSTAMPRQPRLQSSAAEARSHCEPAPGPEAERSRSPPSVRADDDEVMQDAVPTEEEEMQEENDAAATIIIEPLNEAEHTYELVKERFEQKCFFLQHPFSYIVLVTSKDGSVMPIPFTENKIMQRFRALFFYKMDQDEGVWIKKNFTQRWISDVNKKEFETIVIDPSRRNHPLEYNMWPGFLAERLPTVSAEDVEFAMGPIIRHISDVITLGNDTHTQWVLDFLANIVQRPHLKTQVALSLYGKQGVGKGIIFDFFRENVLGRMVSFQTSNATHDLFDKFSNGFVNKVFVQVDEAKDMKQNADSLKHMITGDTTSYESKGCNSIVVDSFVNLVFTSNNQDILEVTDDNRRFVFFKCSNIHRGDKTNYFVPLAAHLAMPTVARGFYQHLMSRDLSVYGKDFQNSRPVTAYEKELKHQNIPIMSCFLSGLVIKIIETPTKVVEFGASGMYDNYVDYFTKNRLANATMLSQRVFGITMSTLIPGITKKKTMTKNVYIFDATLVKRHLEGIHEFDEDADMY